MTYCGQTALFNSKTFILIQKRRPYTGNSNSETLGDSKTVFLHSGGVLDVHQQNLLNDSFHPQGCLWSML